MGSYPTEDDFEGWYVVRTKAFAEKRVASDLGERGIEVYFPRERHLIRRARQTHTVEHALLPRYLFGYVEDAREAATAWLRATRTKDKAA